MWGRRYEFYLRLTCLTRMMISSLTHFPANFISLYSWTNSIAYGWQGFVIRSSTDGHLGWFPAAVNRTARNTMSKCLWGGIQNPLGTRNDIAGLLDSSTFSFGGIITLIFTYTGSHSHQQWMRIPLCPVSPHVLTFVSLIRVICPLWQRWDGISKGSSFEFLWWLRTLIILKNISAICVSSFENCLFSSLALLLIGNLWSCLIFAHFIYLRY